jgi:penicillin-binding protein 1A
MMLRPSSRPPQKPRRNTRNKPLRSWFDQPARVWIGRGALAGVALLFAGISCAVSLLAYYSRGLPSVESLKNYDPPQVSRIVDRKGRIIAELFHERRTVVPMEKVPRVLVLSVLAAEDADFYTHRGLDYAGLLRALMRDLLSDRRMHGASTITQQLIKTILLTPERTLARKAKELILARRLEQELSKDEILHLYLNHINFGHGRYGVQEASRFYFGKNVSELQLAEASLLAGLPQSPTYLSPLTYPEAARRRQSYVLDQLQAKRVQYWDDLPLEEIEKARTAVVRLTGETAASSAAPEVAGLARQMLKSAVGAEAAKHGGYTIQTTIDLELQETARNALNQGLRAVDQRNRFVGPLRPPPKGKRKPAKLAKLTIGRSYDAAVVASDDALAEVTLDIGGYRALASIANLQRFNPKGLSASQFAPIGSQAVAVIDGLGAAGAPARARFLLGPQGAVVVIDPSSRDVLALVGGAEAHYGFDRATQAIRQPGSSFKALTYALAIDTAKYTPASLVIDAPEVFDQWKPDNFETWHYSGAVRLREAVAQSINLVAVRVMTDLTPPRVVDFAHQLGITTDLEPTLALALGASGVRPIELVNAYATFAAAGQYAPYKVIHSIADARGQGVPLPAQPAPREVLKPASAYVLTSMLHSVVEEGTAKSARKLGRPAAGKTGTSNGARDAWFVGYTPDIVAGVWVGFDDQRSLGKNETGGKAAVPIWVDVVQAATAGRPALDFLEPPDVEHVAIDPKTGLRAYEGMADAIDEVFVAGTAPTQTALPPDLLDKNQFVIEQLGNLASPRQP